MKFVRGDGPAVVSERILGDSVVVGVMISACSEEECH